MFYRIYVQTTVGPKKVFVHPHHLSNCQRCQQFELLHYHKMKRTVAEVLVPAVLRLYGHLRPRGGQLAAYLVRIATDLLNDYRHEIEELIENDEELVTRVQQFQETIGLEASFGNARNLVTASAPPEPDTPRARKRPQRPHAHSPRKRALKI